jgi:hypothetical protein
MVFYGINFEIITYIKYLFKIIKYEKKLYSYFLL